IAPAPMYPSRSGFRARAEIASHFAAGPQGCVPQPKGAAGARAKNVKSFLRAPLILPLGHRATEGFVSFILRASVAPWPIQAPANTVKKLCFSVVLLLFKCCPADAADLDLSKARVVVPHGLSGPERKAVQMLIEEVE